MSAEQTEQAGQPRAAAPAPPAAALAQDQGQQPAGQPDQQEEDGEVDYISPAQYYHSRDVALRLKHQDELRRRSGPEAPGSPRHSRAAAGEAARQRRLGETQEHEEERRHPPGSPTNKVMASTLLSGQERMD